MAAARQDVLETACGLAETLSQKVAKVCSHVTEIVKATQARRPLDWGGAFAAEDRSNHLRVPDDLCSGWILGYFRSRLPKACFMTAPPTSEIDWVRGMSLGQASTQF